MLLLREVLFANIELHHEERKRVMGGLVPSDPARLCGLTQAGECAGPKTSENVAVLFGETVSQVLRMRRERVAQQPPRRTLRSLPNHGSAPAPYTRAFHGANAAGSSHPQKPIV